MKRKYLIYLSILLVIIALGFLWVFNIGLKSLQAPVAVTNGIIPTDATENITIENGQSVTEILLQAKSSLSNASGTIIAVNLGINAQAFLTNIGPTAPQSLTKSLAPNFMTGFYHANSGAWQPYIILKTTSYNDALSGMSSWEPTMASDLANLIVTASDTPQASFQDVEIENVDVRELDDMNDGPILMYSLPDNQTIVISTSEAAIREIFARLSPQRFGTMNQ